MKVSFIAHAGFAIEEGSYCIMVDPWFFSSDFANPILYGLLPPNKTIDFQLPDCKDKITNFSSDAILVSHFHTHHSPLREIKSLIRQSTVEKVIVGTPPVGEQGKEKIRVNLGDCLPRTHLATIPKHKIEIQIGPIKVTGLVHTWDDHAAWFIQTPTGSFLHVADARLNRNPMTKEFDPFWRALENLKPDFLAISAAGHCLKRTGNAGPWIMENSTLSPVEAARLVAYIKPKFAGVMGVYQHSIWTNREEYSLSTNQVEDQFAWAVNYLHPITKTPILRPGDQFNFENVLETSKVTPRQILRPVEQAL